MKPRSRFAWKMLLDLLNACLAIATLAMALKRPERVGLLFFVAAPNFLWIMTYFPAPASRSRDAVALGAFVLLLAFTVALRDDSSHCCGFITLPQKNRIGRHALRFAHRPSQ